MGHLPRIYDVSDFHMKLGALCHGPMPCCVCVENESTYRYMYAYICTYIYMYTYAQMYMYVGVSWADAVLCMG